MFSVNFTAALVDQVTFQTDIKIDDGVQSLIEKLKRAYNSSNSTAVQLGASKQLGVLWPNGTVPFEFHNVGKQMRVPFVIQLFKRHSLSFHPPCLALSLCLSLRCLCPRQG